MKLLRRYSIEEAVAATVPENIFDVHFSEIDIFLNTNR